MGEKIARGHLLAVFLTCRLNLASAKAIALKVVKRLGNVLDPEAKTPNHDIAPRDDV